MEKMTSLNYIQTIADMRSISAAAEVLGISQPALSSYLKKQEADIGAVLFDRSKQPLELTEAGRIFLEYIDRRKALNNDITQRIADLSGLKRGKLAIGGASFFNITYLPDAVAEFAHRYPGIDLEIIDGKVPELAARALNGGLDVFITPGGNEDDRFFYEKLLEERIFLCVPSDWAINDELKDKEIVLKDRGDGRNICAAASASYGDEKPAAEELPVVDFSVFRDSTFIVLKENQNIGIKMSKLFAKHGFKPARHILAEQTMTSFALTLAGAGVSLITESCIRNNELGAHPKFYLADPEICRRELFAAYPRQKYLSKAAAEFLSVLKSSVE